MSFRRFLIVLALVVAPFSVQAQREKLPLADLEIVQKTWPEAKRTSTSLRYVVLSEGEGELAKPGNLLRVLYTGRLLNGTVFNEAIDPEKPFEFRLGREQVIAGWDEAFQLMRPGEKRLLIIPFELGYGTRGQLPKIPPRTTLIFEVHLLEVRK